MEESRIDSPEIKLPLARGMHLGQKNMGLMTRDLGEEVLSTYTGRNPWMKMNFCLKDSITLARAIVLTS